MYGNQKMGAYANATGANTQFYLTRVLPGDAGKTLVLNFFDTGDASQPGDARGPSAGRFERRRRGVRELQVRAATGELERPTVGVASAATATGCKITGVSSAGPRRTTGNGSPGRSRFPQDYTCNSADPLGCWTKLQFVYPVGTTVSDTTTWSAYILGEPVRLIE